MRFAIIATNNIDNQISKAIQDSHLDGQQVPHQLKAGGVEGGGAGRVRKQAALGEPWVVAAWWSGVCGKCGRTAS